MSPAPAVVRSSAVTTYWQRSRAPRYSLLFVLPLFAVYEALAAAIGGSSGATNVRNAADVVLKTPFIMVSGARGSMAFFATVIAICVFLVVRDLRKSRDRLRPSTFSLMLGESAVLAALLGIVVGIITQRLISAMALSAQAGATGIEHLPMDARLMLALGAGLYEELLFRVLLVGGLAMAFRWLLPGRAVAGVLAAVVGALVFSAFHYVGEYGDRLEIGSFVYRAVAGLTFSALYLTRGFGITAWTHALYDVYVMVL